MFKASCFIAAVALCLSLTGCNDGSKSKSDDGFLFFTSTSKSQLPVEPVSARENGYGTTWIRDLKLDKKTQVKSVDVLKDVVITIETPGNIISATRLSNGELMWRKGIGADFELLYGPVRFNDRILINSEIRMYQLAVDDGKIEYVTTLDYPVNHKPALVREFAVFGSRGGRAFAHDLKAGSATWEHQLTGEIRVTPVATDFDVFIADARGVYKMFKADDGALLWDGRAYAPIVAAPVVSNAVYVPSVDQTLYVLDRTTGDERWAFRHEEPLRQSPSVFGRYVFQPLNGDGLVALSASTGEELWRIDDDARAVNVVGDRVVLRLPSSIRFADVRNGQTISEVKTAPLAGGFQQDDDSIILVSRKGVIQRLDKIR